MWKVFTAGFHNLIYINYCILQKVTKDAGASTIVADITRKYNNNEAFLANLWIWQCKLFSSLHCIQYFLLCQPCNLFYCTKQGLFDLTFLEAPSTLAPDFPNWCSHSFVVTKSTYWPYMESDSKTLQSRIPTSYGYNTIEYIFYARILAS